MMTGAKNILYGWMATLMLGCCTLFVVSCSSDDPEQEQKPEQGDRLQLVSFTRSGDDFDQASIKNDSRIRMFITSNEEEPKQATFIWNNPSWSKDGKIKENADYYLYGVLSGDDITTNITPSTNYSSGATLTVSNLSPLALEGQDPCVIVGVKGTLDGNLGESVVERGKFYYKGQSKDHNYVHLLLDRLYSAVTFQFGPLDAEYASLRTIKLTKLQLKVNLSSDSKLNMTVPLTAGSSPVGTITTSTQSGSSSSECTITLFEDADGKEFSEIVDGDIQVGCFAPGYASDLSVVSYYDVYDKGATPYKLSSRTAENALGGILTYTDPQTNTQKPTLTRGEKLTLTLTVNPSYLYQLSDPDATTIKISAN
ncbi:MAG: hypothetical protein IKI06_08285 [Prevotella sp.]|nr:hypothetical protein [Prevotella sp.]